MQRARIVLSLGRPLMWNSCSSVHRPTICMFLVWRESMQIKQQLDQSKEKCLGTKSLTDVQCFCRFWSILCLTCTFDSHKSVRQYTSLAFSSQLQDSSVAKANRKNHFRGILLQQPGWQCSYSFNSWWNGTFGLNATSVWLLNGLQ